METVYFYHPARNDRVGGAQLVVCNIAEFFISKDINIGLIDYPDGFCKKELDRRGCDIYDFIDLSEIEKVKISGRILAFNQFLNHSPIYFSGSSKVIIWDVYYPFWGMLYSGLIRKFKRNLITLIASKKALIVMDAMGKNEIERIIDYSSNIKVVPVPNEKIPICVNTELDDDLSISYLGRAEIWKVTPFCKLYMDVRKVTDAKFSVYTDDVEEFKSLVHKVNAEIVLDNVLFFENFPRKNIYENIAKKSTFAAAMGTAALEIANSGVPTILLDLSYNEFPDEYKYKWLYQNKMKGSLGRDITNDHDHDHDGYSVDEILEQLDNIRKDISKDCMEYVKINHSIEYVAQEILSSFEESELSIDEINKFIEKNKFLFYYLKAKFFLRTTILKKSALAYIE